MPSRYDRQLPLIGNEGQEKLKGAIVGIAGCGGLGTTVVTDLASAGVGHLVLADGDAPDITNLNRQFVFREGQSRKKSELLSEWAASVNPEVKADPFTEALDEDNICSVFAGCDILVDCLDSISARKLLSRYAVSSGKTLVHAGVTGFTGQLTVVVPGKTPDLEQIYSTVKDAPIGTVTPSVGSMVSTMASMEATQVIQLLTGVGSPFVGRMLVLDFENGSSDILEF